MPRKIQLHEFTCEYCQEKYLGRAGKKERKCKGCAVRLEVDPSVSLSPTRKARCGHLSHEYYACAECGHLLVAMREEGFGNISEQLKKFNPETGYSEGKRVGGLRQKVQSLKSNRGYSFCKKRNKYCVTFRGHLVGLANTAEEARQIYINKVEEYRNAVQSSDQAV